jgi:hypothetical protein
VLLLVCGAAVADAQSQSGRPYKALFGGATNDPTVQQSLDVTASVSEGYDDNVLADLGASSAAGPAFSGVYTALVPAMNYDWVGHAVQISATASSSFKYFQPEHQFIGTSHFGAVGLSAGSQATRFSFNQSFSYSPAYYYGLFPTLTTASDVGYVVGADSDYAVGAKPILAYDTSANFSQRLSARSTVTAVGTFLYSDLSRVPNSRNLSSYSAGGRYAYGLSRYANVHFGYVYREGQYYYAAGSQPAVSHDIDIGVDYHKPLSFSRRTHFDFSVGSSLLNTPSFDLVQTHGFQYVVLGNASLTHDIARTWRARLVYDRGIGFVQGLAGPVVSDAVKTSVDGFLSRRMDMHVTAGFQDGNVGNAHQPRSSVRSYSGSARLQFALDRTWALFSEYTYYSYTLGAAVIGTGGIPQALDRNNVRVGLTVWAPLVRK